MLFRTTKLEQVEKTAWMCDSCGEFRCSKRIVLMKKLFRYGLCDKYDLQNDKAGTGVKNMTFRTTKLEQAKRK
jgi:hypothetical protein